MYPTMSLINIEQGQVKLNAEQLEGQNKPEPRQPAGWGDWSTYYGLLDNAHLFFLLSDGLWYLNLLGNILVKHCQILQITLFAPTYDPSLQNPLYQLGFWVCRRIIS